MTTPTPDSVYEKVWKPLLEDASDRDTRIKELLFDYGALLSDTANLYAYLTEGRIQNPQHPVDDVIELADQLAADSIDAGIRTVLSAILDELDRTSTGSAEEKLDLLTKTITSLFEQGHSDNAQ